MSLFGVWVLDSAISGTCNESSPRISCRVILAEIHFINPFVKRRENFWRFFLSCLNMNDPTTVLHKKDICLSMASLRGIIALLHKTDTREIRRDWDRKRKEESRGEKTHLWSLLFWKTPRNEYIGRDPLLESHICCSKSWMDDVLFVWHTSLSVRVVCPSSCRCVSNKFAMIPKTVSGSTVILYRFPSLTLFFSSIINKEHIVSLLNEEEGRESMTLWQTDTLYGETGCLNLSCTKQ